jgi:hypothetical protein
MTVTSDPVSQTIDATVRRISPARSARSCLAAVEGAGEGQHPSGRQVGADRLCGHLGGAEVLVASRDTRLRSLYRCKDRSVPDGAEYIEKNRDLWEKRVRAHLQEGLYPSALVEAGTYEVGAPSNVEVGDITGKRLLHL